MRTVSRVELAMGAVAGLAFAVVAGEWQGVALLLVAAVLVSPWIERRYQVTQAQQRRRLAWLSVPFVLLGAVRMANSRSTIATSLGIAVLGTVYVFACGVIELYRHRDQVRPEVYHMAMLTVMMVGGMSPDNRLYPLALILYFVLGVSLLRNPHGGWWRRSGRTSRAPLGGIVAAFALAVLMAIPARFLMPDVGRVLMRAYFLGFNNPFGEARLFTATSDLGTVQRLQGSRAVVARVWGPNTQLRGQVYTTYSGGRWSAPVLRERRRDYVADQGWIQLPGAALPEGAQTWEIAPVKDVAGPIPSPAGVYRIQGFSELAQDSYDALIGDTIDPYKVVASDRCDSRSPARLRPDHPEYLEVPPELAEWLRRWSDPIVGKQPAYLALREYLAQQGTYDVKARRASGVDPVQAFVEGGMHGHCELFASTMALTLRARGIPARYVVGFQMGERNPLGGYAIIRDRDAHAWVEAYVDGSWQSFDPTPSGQWEATHPEGDQTGWGEALSDRLGGWGSAFLAWLRQASLPMWLIPSGLLVGLLWLVRRHPGGWWARSRGPQGDALWLAFERRLRGVGVLRGPSETCRELGSRLAQELDPGCLEPYQQWLGLYERHRFGGGAAPGDPAALPQAVRRKV